MAKKKTKTKTRNGLWARRSMTLKCDKKTYSFKSSCSSLPDDVYDAWEARGAIKPPEFFEPKGGDDSDQG